MRSSPKSEKEKQEIEASERRERRKGGYDLMHVRDRGWGKLDNGVVMSWHVEPEKRYEGITYSGIPDGYFVLHTGKDSHVFDKEDFMRWLRWA
jgi:hypothetical protein